MKFEKFELSIILPFDYASSDFPDLGSDKMPMFSTLLEQNRKIISEIHPHVFHDRGRNRLLNQETAVVKTFKLNEKLRKSIGIHHNEDHIYHFAKANPESPFQITRIYTYFFSSGKAFLTLLIKAENLSSEQVLDLKNDLLSIRCKQKICYQKGIAKDTYTEETFTIKELFDKLLKLLDETELSISLNNNYANIYSLAYGLANQIPEDCLLPFLEMLRLNRRSGMVNTSHPEEAYLYQPFSYISWTMSERGLSVVGDCKTAGDLAQENVGFLRKGLEESVFKIYQPFYLYYLNLHLQCTDMEINYDYMLEHNVMWLEESKFRTLKKIENDLIKLSVQDHINKLFLEYLCDHSLNLKKRLEKLHKIYESQLTEKKYNTFISYRRDKGGYLALLICYILRNDGKEVFLDLDSMRSGEFDRQLYDVIDQCTNVIVILSPGCLDHFNKLDEEDWMREEITYAIEKHKKIIPIKMEGFKYPSTLPEKIQNIPKHQTISCYLDKFHHMLEDISNMMK